MSVIPTRVYSVLGGENDVPTIVHRIHRREASSYLTSPFLQVAVQSVTSRHLTLVTAFPHPLAQAAIPTRCICLVPWRTPEYCQCAVSTGALSQSAPNPAPATKQIRTPVFSEAGVFL